MSPITHLLLTLFTIVGAVVVGLFIFHKVL